MTDVHDPHFRITITWQVVDSTTGRELESAVVGSQSGPFLASTKIAAATAAITSLQMMASQLGPEAQMESVRRASTPRVPAPELPQPPLMVEARPVVTLGVD